MKYVGNMPSLVQGVSQEEPHNRGPGKMWESVNFIDSPTKGKARRRGSVYAHHVAVGAANATALAEARRMDEYTFIIDGREYSLIYRPFASAQGEAYFAQLFSKDDGEFYELIFENSAWVDELVLGGVSSLAVAGRTLLIAGNTTIPQAAWVNLWEAPTNIQKLSGWVREGAYSRKFTAVLYRADGSKVEYSYTTKSAAYPVLLDTSDIPFYKPDGTTPDPEYQKLVNDRVNAYEGERTAWIKESAEDIVPANIATKLAELMQDDDIIASSIGPCVIIDDPEFVDIRMLDDGANTLVSAVGKEISDPQNVTLYHWVGKIVRVRPQGAGANAAYYLQAIALEGGTGWQKVEWVETAGVRHTVNNLVAQLAVDPNLKQAYIAQNAAGLETLAPALGEFVDYKPSSVGDAITSPVPHFFGRKIECISMFQDRLLVTANNIVSASRSSDYFNFFRTTVLNIQDDDPIEMFAHGSEGDTIKRAVMYDKSLIFFGMLRQYAINGREFLSPNNPNISVIGGYEGASQAQPIASGNLLFFGKTAEERTGLHQMRPGETAETTWVDDVSDELDDYIEGTSVQLLGMTMPNTVMMRTDSVKPIWYLYKYADTAQNERVLASWGKFEYNEAVGSIAGIAHKDGVLYVYTLRSAGGQDYWFADKQSLEVKMGDKPHLDSQVPWESLTPWHSASIPALSVAADATSDYFLLGSPAEDAAAFIEQAPGVEDALKCGLVSPAYFQPTNPYLRDSEGGPILNARLTLVQMLLHLSDTGGFSSFVLARDTQRTLLFEGRIIGHSTNIIGRQPVYDGTRQVSVGREVGSCIVEIRSEDWQPLRVTGAEWTGQGFMPRARGLY